MSDNGQPPTYEEMLLVNRAPVWPAIVQSLKPGEVRELTEGTGTPQSKRVAVSNAARRAGIPVRTAIRDGRAYVVRLKPEDVTP